MTPSLNSQSFKSAPSFEIDATVRELVAAMPLVIFFNAIREALGGRKAQPVPVVATRTFRTR